MCGAREVLADHDLSNAVRRDRQLEMARVELMHSQKMQALGHLLADLGTAGSHLVGNGDDGHGIHSFRYLAFNAAGAMAILLPPTSSRT